MTEPYEIEVRERDALLHLLKGPEPPGMTRAQWDVRYLLDVLDSLRAEMATMRDEIAALPDADDDEFKVDEDEEVVFRADVLALIDAIGEP